MALSISHTVKKYLNSPVKAAFNIINSAVLGKNSCDKKTSAILSLISAVIWADGNVSENEIELYKSYLAPNCSKTQLNKYSKILQKRSDSDISQTCLSLRDLSQNEKEEIIKALIAIAEIGPNNGELEFAIVNEIADKLEVDENIYNLLLENSKKEKELRDKVLRSGSGILAALVIILLFALTATFLKSVLFGVILAYLFLPLQRLIEHKVLPNPISQTCLQIIALPFKPFKFLASKFSSLFKPDTTESETPTNNNKDLACHLTLLTALFILLFSICTVSWLSAQKITSIGKSTSSWLSNHSQVYDLEYLKPKLEQIPGFTTMRDEISLYLNDKENQKKLAMLFIDNSKGVFATLLSVLSSLSSILLDALLATFFFSFFLQKMASFESKGKNWDPGGYFIESIFATSWMPPTTPATKNEAKKIINEIFNKLHIWIKGYASIILIESIIYVSIFIILGLPYPTILGLIAGCTVLLPFIGPLASGLLTILVYVAVTGSSCSMTIVALIIITYSIMNGIIEQLMLYPALIGEALGLTTLETIIVVLLGGLFAGLSGMIFAVPVASILKLLIPRIYSCWQTN